MCCPHRPVHPLSAPESLPSQSQVILSHLRADDPGWSLHAQATQAPGCGPSSRGSVTLCQIRERLLRGQQGSAFTSRVSSLWVSPASVCIHPPGSQGATFTVRRSQFPLRCPFDCAAQPHAGPPATTGGKLSRLAAGGLVQSESSHFKERGKASQPRTRTELSPEGERRDGRSPSRSRPPEPLSRPRSSQLAAHVPSSDKNLLPSAAYWADVLPSGK